MKIPNFHDGYFDGFRIGSGDSLQIFLRTAEKVSYTLVFQGVQALALSGVKIGNIIFDLVFRAAPEITASDIAELYEVGIETAQAETLLHAARGKGLQILEVNPSYGAQGLILFEACRTEKG